VVDTVVFPSLLVLAVVVSCWLLVVVVPYARPLEVVVVVDAVDGEVKKGGNVYECELVMLVSEIPLLEPEVYDLLVSKLPTNDLVVPKPLG